MIPDVVIAGGGAAACVLAARLSEDPARHVVVLEAGPDYPDAEAAPAIVRYGWGGSSILDDPLDLDWAYMATATAAGGEIVIPRGRLVGGSGSINGQIFLRGLPEDFARWEQVAGPAIDWPTMDGAYRALEADGLFRVRVWPSSEWVSTQAAFVEACDASGYGRTADHNAPDAMGAGPLPFNQDDRIRWGPALAYLTPAVRARPNLEIRPSSVVRRVNVEGGRASGVDVEDPAGVQRLDAGEVIVSAGAIGTPHLLLHSGIGPADDLARLGIVPVLDRRGVGRNLRDHPKAWVEWRLRDHVVIDDPAPGLQTSARYTATGSPNRGDMMLYPNSVIPTSAGGRTFRLEVVDNLELSAGAVRLRSADPAVAPAIDLGFFAESVDRERLSDGIRRVIDLGGTTPMASMLHERILPADDALATPAALHTWLDRHVMTGHHVSSTARIGQADDPDAVVDAAGRVHGIDRLRVVDASIMPDSVRANIHATVIALAEVVAQRILAGT